MAGLHVTPVMTRLLDLATAPLPDDALAVVRLSLIDWAACGIAGAEEPVARCARAVVAEEAGLPQASLFGGGRAPARAAALVNGAASHALDYDDTHFAHIGHPSVAVLPAALAMGERCGATLDAVIGAALRGCEASIRMGLALGRDHYQVGFHQTGTAGAFGATLACGVLLGLSRDQMTQALALVSTRAGGLKSQFGTMGKPLNAGFAAANGVEATLLAAHGVLSNPEALEGINGFLPTHHAAPSAQPDGWLMTHVSHKFHACCHGLHATLEALSKLTPGPADKIQSIVVSTHPRWLTVCNLPNPETGLELKFSYRGIVAAHLLGRDTAALDTYSDGLCHAAPFQALRDLVRVEADPTLSEMQARVWIDGQAAEHDLNEPLPLSGVEEKLRRKTRALLGRARSDQLWSALGSGDVTTLTARF